MSDLVEEVREALQAFPEIDGETEDEAIGYLIVYLEHHDDVEESEIVSWALEDAGVPREERLTIVDEVEEGDA